MNYLKIILFFIIIIFTMDTEIIKAAQKNDVIEASMHGNDIDLLQILDNKNIDFKIKLKNKVTVDARNIALYCTLVCNKPKNADILLKKGFKFDNLPIYPDLIQKCKNKFSLNIIRKNLLDQQEWLKSLEQEEYQSEGDCSNGEIIQDIIYSSSPEILEVILKNNKSICKFKSKCGFGLLGLLKKQQNAKKMISIYKKYCK